MEALRIERLCTYADYYAWEGDERYELIDGVAYAMSPAPTMGHQSVTGNIYHHIRLFLRDKPCKVFISPFDVRLNGDGDDDTDVVQPDVVVVCDKTKLDYKGCNGAPDLAVEVLSPSSVKKDTVMKFHAYQRAGVREFWIVDPGMKTVMVHILDAGRYVTSTYTDDDIVPVHVLDGCMISLPDIFAE